MYKLKSILSIVSICFVLMAISMCQVDGDGDPNNPIVIEPADLTVDDALAAVVQPGDTNYYCVELTPNTNYTVALMGIEDRPTNLMFQAYRDIDLLDIITSLWVQYAPAVFNFTASSNKAYLAVNAENINSKAVEYTILITETPSVDGSPTSEGERLSRVTVPTNTAYLGQVATLGTSYYACSGLDPDTLHTVSILQLTEHVYLEAGGPCPETMSSYNIRECTKFSGSEIGFNVASGPLNKVGGFYLIYVQ